MTSRSAGRRLDLVARFVNSQPLSLQALDEVYARFLATGALPDDQRMARAVIERALVARSTGRATRQAPGRPLAGPPRERVFREAAHPFETPRMAARLLIKLLVQMGGDPSDPEFIPSDYEMPEFGGVAMHILGWPDQWVKPPYEQQMERVLAQHAELRKRGPRSELWYREAAGTLAAFLRTGELPDDCALRSFALTIGEEFALHRHYLGHGGEELLAAYDTVASTTGEQRSTAMRRLGELQAREAG